MRASRVILLGVIVGCGSAPMSTQTPANVTSTGDPMIVDASDPAEAAWSRRASAADATTAMTLWTQEAEDDDPVVLIRVAQARHFLATVHATDTAEILAHAEAGLAAADAALDVLEPDVLEQLALPTDPLSAVTSDNAPALYWHARLQLVRAAAQGFAQLLLVDARVTRALAACERVLPQYDNFGAVVLLAERDAHPLDASQRDLASARRRLDRAIAAEPELLAHRVALAEHYAVIAGDRTLFERELSAVKQAKLTSAAVPEQGLAQTRAAALLDRMNELFE